MSDDPDRRSVFVVHGRNEALRRAMFDFLRSINLNPIEWTTAVAMTGKGSPYIGEILDAAFARAAAIVVLMTPDEVAYLQPAYGSGEGDPETLPAAQARPNVLFEAGMALGRDADRTVLVEVGAVRPFSDVAGRHAVRLGNDVASRQALASRLMTAEADVRLDGTDWHTAGDFTPPPPPGGGLPLARRLPGSAERPALDFDLRFFDKGGSRIDKLQVINRGRETAYDVQLEIPEGTSLDLMRAGTIPKIPGRGKAVTIDAMAARFLGDGDKAEAFDVTITARTEAGEQFTQDVFLDMNG